MTAVATRIICSCDRRRQAQASGELIYWEVARGWVFTDLPKRQMDARAKYYAFIDRSEYDHDDHSGEPFVFELCVFCGHEMPGTPSIVKWKPQADGE